MPSNKFTTTDYGLANWLVFNRVELLGAVEIPPETRKSFVFTNQEDMDYLVQEWQAPTTDEAAICKAFFKAHTLIKKTLKESLNVQEFAGPSSHNQNI